MIFSRATFKNIKHKTKKGLMKRIGSTESQPEDPIFKNILTTLTEVKQNLREFYNMSRSVATSGKQFNENLEKFCGFGIRSEEVFTKEAEFLNVLEERVCTAIGRIVNKDLNTLDEVIVQYKTAKLKFDALHFKTVKQMRKKGIAVTVEQADDVMLANANLPARLEAYLAAKLNVRMQRDVILTHLKTKVENRLEELRLVSDAQHHQLYCRYLKERLTKTVEICSQELSNEEVGALVRGNSFSHYRSKPSAIVEKSSCLPGLQIAGNEKVFEDQKDTDLESLESIENKTQTSKAADKNEGSATALQKHTQNPAQKVFPPGVDDSKKQTVDDLPK